MYKDICVYIYTYTSNKDIRNLFKMSTRYPAAGRPGQDWPGPDLRTGPGQGLSRVAESSCPRI